ncbi:hypothetical protein RN001_009604 [Aquatica leii]|uniref:Glutathione S-transferase n=1 Tax=Aquatica leii TaxID=1421715 RepID=A0AAN7QGJ8_9COLE|nr:hypothetical protein RN001_009604 [Aquatica leii]
MAPKLYTQDMSPTCRSVYLTAAALDLKLELITVDVWKNQQFSKSFLEINPTHTIPTLDDDGTIVWDSNAINIYLVSKYGKDDSLYPNDINIRAVINQRLFYNANVIFHLAKSLILKTAKRKPFDKDDVTEIRKIYEVIEKFLETTTWMGCDTVTIVDFAIFSFVLFLVTCEPLDSIVFPRVSKWVQKMKNLPYFYVMKKGMQDIETFTNERLNIKSEPMIFDELPLKEKEVTNLTDFYDNNVPSTSWEGNDDILPRSKWELPFKTYIAKDFIKKRTVTEKEFGTISTD